MADRAVNLRPAPISQSENTMALAFSEHPDHTRRHKMSATDNDGVDSRRAAESRMEDVNESSENAEDWEDIPTWPRAYTVTREGALDHVRDSE
jgi:hypothetical protein